MATKEDALWFKHESTSGKSLKIRKLQRIYGHWGKGIYWDVCEFLLEQENFQFVCDESSLQVISDMIGCNDEIKFLSWFNDCINLGLLEKDDKMFYSPALLKRLGKLMTSRENGGKGGRPKKTEIKPNDNLTETKEEPNNNQSVTNRNHTKSNTNTKNIYIISEDKREKSKLLWEYLLKSKQWIDPLIMKHETNMKLIALSLKDFFAIQNLIENPREDAEEVKKHFGNWLKTNPPEKAKHIHEDLLQGEWGVDFHLKPTPNYEEEVEELLKDGWVRTKDGMAKRIKPIV
jgi:hypothetical protein